MSQTSRESALQRIEDGLVRLGRAIGGLPSGASAGPVSHEAHEALLSAHEMLRARAEAAVEGIDRLIGRSEAG